VDQEEEGEAEAVEDAVEAEGAEETRARLRKL
jgi:hypothetical protein